MVAARRTLFLFNRKPPSSIVPTIHQKQNKRMAAGSQRLEKRPRQMVADGGYTTRDNIEKMAGRGIDFLGSMEKTANGATAPQRLRLSAGEESLSLPGG
jgi:hypothetical protein